MTRERDPSNQWLWAVPLTDAELAQARRASLEFLDWPADLRFTCDGCPLAPRCSLAFDPYNTEGDCLYEK